MLSETMRPSCFCEVRECCLRPYAMVLEMSEKSEMSMGEAKISHYVYHSEAPSKVWEAAWPAKVAQASGPSCLAMCNRL